MLTPKMKYPALILYAIDIIVVATLRDKTPVHLAIHFGNCVLIFYAMNFLLKPSISSKKLELTSDEIYILDEMLQGKQQKEIQNFSANTVTNKLRSARERNNIATTDELLQKYKLTLTMNN